MAEELERKPTKALVDEILFETIDNFSIQKTGSAERGAEAENAERLSRVYANLSQAETEEDDRRERRRIEEEKNAANLEIERAKEKPFWWHCAEWVTTRVLPQLISDNLMALWFNKFQKRTLQFEETGTFRSKASKDLRSSWSFWK